jgi:hypothetical protein
MGSVQTHFGLDNTATVARLQAETARLRQRVAELERLVGQLKGRLWPTASRR